MNYFWSNRVCNISTYSQDEFDSSITIKLDTNENPYEPSEYVKQCIIDEVNNSLNRYPDCDATELREALASYLGISPKQIFVGNGSDEVLAFLFQALFNTGDRIALFDVTYSFYKVYADYSDIECDVYKVDESLKISLKNLEGNYKGIVIANPNAMTGIKINKQEIL